MNRYFQLASADLVVPNQEAWALLWDFQTLVRRPSLSRPRAG
jgi:alpha-mannosidase